MMLPPRTVLALTVVLCVAATSANASLLIDGFGTNQDLTADFSTPSASGTVGGTDIIGGVRYAETSWTSGPGRAVLETNANGNGLLNFSLDSDTFGTAQTVWNGGSTLDVDLTDGGTLDRIRLGLPFLDLPAELCFTLITNPGAQAGISQYEVMLAGATMPPGIEVDLLFDDFVEVSGGGVTLTDVDEIVLDICPTYPATDLQLDFIEVTTPEPATLILLAAGALAVYRRR